MHYLLAVVKSPLSVERDAVSDLHNTLNRADYLVISPSEFYTAAQTLAAYRSSQGLQTMSVDVQDVYDEFNYGIPDAEAIHQFISYTYASWTQPVPSYVVLLGDGNFDPKDNLGLGEKSHIPPYLADVDPWIRETASDNRYVCVSGDDTLPDLFIGRLPANSLDEANALVSKVISYEQTPPSGSWASQMLFIADNADSAGDFAADSDVVADNYVPSAYSVEKVYYGITHLTPESARTAIPSSINSGKLIVNYAGHGSAQLWATEQLLTTGILATLTNTDELPFVAPMTCYEGYFIWPGHPSMAETFVRLPTTGAIASWSPPALASQLATTTSTRAFSRPSSKKTSRSSDLRPPTPSST